MPEPPHPDGVHVSEDVAHIPAAGLEGDGGQPPGRKCRQQVEVDAVVDPPAGEKFGGRIGSRHSFLPDYAPALPGSRGAMAYDMAGYPSCRRSNASCPR